MSKIELDDMIKEVERTVTMRRGALEPSESRTQAGILERAQLNRMDAVLTVLYWLKTNRSWVVSASPESPLLGNDRPKV